MMLYRLLLRIEKNGIIFCFMKFFSLFFLVLLPYIIVQEKLLSSTISFWVIVLLTIVQIFLHVKFCFHLEYFEDYYWSIIISFFSLLIIFIVISGSVWIMNDLNQHMMTNLVHYQT